MILSDRSLKRRPSLVQPIRDGAVQPSSIDLHLGERLLRMPYGLTIDPEADQSAAWQEVPLNSDGRWWIGQHTLYLAVTEERITVPDDAVGLLHGISSLGRLGLLVHITAGLIDPQWSGRPTLELVSLGGTMLLRPGMRIGQITVHQLSSPCDSGYSGKYAEDVDPQPSRMWQEARP